MYVVCCLLCVGVCLFGSAFVIGCVAWLVVCCCRCLLLVVYCGLAGRGLSRVVLVRCSACVVCCLLCVDCLFVVRQLLVVLRW